MATMKSRKVLPKKKVLTKKPLVRTAAVQRAAPVKKGKAALSANGKSQPLLFCRPNSSCSARYRPISISRRLAN